MTRPTLHDYQVNGVQGIGFEFKRGYKAVLYVLATGAGKTFTFTWMAAQAAEKGRRVLLLAPRKEILGQISAALSLWDTAHGIISPSAKPTHHPVQVAMVQTLANRIKLDRNGRFKFDFVIIDEAHHATDDSTWGAILRHNSEAKILGVTATPCRLDGKGLGVGHGGPFEAMVIGPSTQGLIDMGRLVRPVVYAPEHSVDLSGIKKRGGDYVRGDLAARMDQAALTGDAVLHYRRHCDRQPAIAFTVTVEHAGHVVEQFKASGYQAAVLTGSTPDKERAAMIRDLGAGHLHVLASCNVVSEGTDIPNVMAAILLRPTASYALAMQQMGRALRVCPGKDRAIILDHAGNCHRHGLPTEPVEWSLSGMRRKSRSDLKPCFDCQSLIPVRARSCPACGKMFAGRGREDPRHEVQDELPLVRSGELVELTPELRAKLRRWRIEQERQARTLDDFKRIAQACGYKPGWARFRYEELRGRGDDAAGEHIGTGFLPG
jgi:DNA repair protein RadD